MSKCACGHLSSFLCVCVCTFVIFIFKSGGSDGRPENCILYISKGQLFRPCRLPSLTENWIQVGPTVVEATGRGPSSCCCSACIWWRMTGRPRQSLRCVREVYRREEGRDRRRAGGSEPGARAGGVVREGEYGLDGNIYRRLRYTVRHIQLHLRYAVTYGVRAVHPGDFSKLSE